MLQKTEQSIDKMKENERKINVENLFQIQFWKFSQSTHINVGFRLSFEIVNMNQNYTRKSSKKLLHKMENVLQTLTASLICETIWGKVSMTPSIVPVPAILEVRSFWPIFNM